MNIAQQYIYANIGDIFSGLGAESIKKLAGDFPASFSFLNKILLLFSFGFFGFCFRFRFFRQAGNHAQAFLGASFYTCSADDTAETLKLPLFGLTGYCQRIGRTLFGAHAAEDTCLFIDDKFAAFAREGITHFCRIVAGYRAFDQVAENIFEYRK